MITVGVYGDSFGAPTVGAPAEISKEGFKHHWLTNLANKLNWDITNYSISGASVYEAYRNFLRDNKKYDLNIVIITITGRYHNNIELSFKQDAHITSLPNIQTFIEIHQAEHNFTEEDLQTLRDLEGWYRLGDHFYEYSMIKLMYNHMKQLRPNTVFIRVSDELEDVDNYPLFNIFQDQCHLLGKTHDDPIFNEENPRLISGHFTPEIHDLVADYVLSKINTGKWPKWEIPGDFKFKHSFTEYYKNTL